MANTASAIKRIRSNERKRQRNQIIRTRVRNAVRSAREATESAGAESRQAVLAAISALDRAAEKGVIHKNNAARRKSRLMKRLNQIQAEK